MSVFVSFGGFARCIDPTGENSHARQFSGQRADQLRPDPPGNTASSTVPQSGRAYPGASCVPQAEEKPVMKLGLFINTQFPEGFNLAERVPGNGRTSARGA